MEERAPVISVIVPVYNTKAYLCRCLDSLIAQTYRKFEIILVDDGSKDSSGTICEEYAAKYEYIYAYHQENKGVVCARNLGIYYSKGRYLSFVDADDWVEENFLKEFVENMEKHSADIVLTGYCRDVGGRRKEIKNNIESGVYENASLVQFYKRMLYYKDFYEFGIQPFLVNKLFERNLFLKCSAELGNDIYEAEDAAIVYPYLLHCRKVVVTEDCLYHYVYRETSATNNRKFDYFENISRLYLYLNQKFRETQYYNIMQPQLGPYMRMLVFIENPTAFIAAEQKIFPFRKVWKDSKIILYGAGYLGKIYHKQIRISGYCQIVAWVDEAYLQEKLKKLGVVGVQAIEKMKYDYIVIAIENKEIICMVKRMFKRMGICTERIICEEIIDE